MRAFLTIMWTILCVLLISSNMYFKVRMRTAQIHMCTFHLPYMCFYYIYVMSKCAFFGQLCELHYVYFWCVHICTFWTQICTPLVFTCDQCGSTYYVLPMTVCVFCQCSHMDFTYNYVKYNMCSCNVRMRTLSMFAYVL